MRRKGLRRVGHTMLTMGGFVLYFMIYQLVGTNAVTSQAQDDLREDLAQQLAAPAGATQPASAGASSEPASQLGPLVVGEPIGLITIPKIDHEYVMVEGADQDSLRKGPGHIPGTGLPGQPGNFAVSGHRTTYGAPFFDLDQLTTGDQILIQTKAGTYTYLVTETKVVLPTETWVLDDVAGPNGQPKSMITLTTCWPKYSAEKRLIIFGELTRQPQA